MPGISERQEKTPASAELPRKSNQRYKFIRSIGFGGMKAVLLVHDEDTGREVAMAMMPDFRNRPATDVIRFNREARICALLEHPNIVPVHDMGTDMSGAPFFTMKYLRGQSLAAMMRKYKQGDESIDFSLSTALRIYIRVCNALEFAHSKGILHLDIKPDNVNVGAFGEVTVIDWGLAEAVKGNRENFSEAHAMLADFRSTQNGIAKGTPGYMSPEQAAGLNDVLDQRSDIYGLGGLLYTMLVLHSPLSGVSVENILEATIRGEIPPPSQCALETRPVPEALEAICRKAMAHNPAERYQTVQELREDIEAFRSGYAPKALNASTLTRTAFFVSRNLLVTLMAAVILILGGALIYLMILDGIL